MTYETNHENYSSANNLNKTKHSSSKTLRFERSRIGII